MPAVYLMVQRIAPRSPSGAAKLARKSAQRQPEQRQADCHANCRQKGVTHCPGADAVVIVVDPVSHAHLLAYYWGSGPMGSWTVAPQASQKMKYVEPVLIAISRSTVTNVAMAASEREVISVPSEKLSLLLGTRSQVFLLPHRPIKKPARF